MKEESSEEESYEEIIKIHKLSDLIHRTITELGWTCYHPGVGLYCCIGIAREVLRNYEVKERSH